MKIRSGWSASVTHIVRSFVQILFRDINIPNQAETMLEPVPDGDILIHSGDFTNYGRKEEVVKFNNWLGTLPHR